MSEAAEPVAPAPDALVPDAPVPDALGDPDEDRGRARERTALAWTRTALSFGALGGVVLKSHVIIGLIVLALVPVVWQVGRLADKGPPERIDGRIKMIAGTVIAVSAVALVVAFLGRGTPLTPR